MSIINTNVMSLNSQRNLATNNASLGTTIQRLSSGLRINSAKDDAAGLAISERFTTQIRGMNQAARNANDGISLAQTAEGALGEIGNNLQRIRELAVQSRNATNSADDRKALQKEVDQLKSEIDRVASQTSFNGTKLLDGNFTSQAFQVGANQGETITIDAIANASIAKLGAWTSASTAAVTPAGVAPTGGAVAGTPATPTTTVASGAYTQAASTTGTDAFQFKIDGLVVSDRVVASATAANLDTDIDAFIAANSSAYSKSGSVATDDLVITKLDGTDATIATSFSDAVGSTATAAGTTSGGTFAGVGFVGTATNGTPATGGTPASFGAGSFTVNGKTINVAAAADAATRVADLATAINGAGAGVTASVSGGVLSLTSNSTSSSIVIGGASAGFNLTQQTGLAAGTSNPVPGTAQEGFASLDISSVVGADNAILAMDAALNSVNGARADLGAIQNRFSSVIANLNTTAENLTASRSRIRDTDFAKETAELARTQILAQAGTAMLAQANQSTQSVLSLLR